MDRGIQWNGIIPHLLLWLVVWFIYPIYAIIVGGEFGVAMVVRAIYLVGQIIAFYWLTYYQIPQLLERRKYLRFIGSLLLSGYLTSVLTRFNVVYIGEPFLYAGEEEIDPIWDILTNHYAILGQYLMWTYLTPLMILSLKLVKDNFEARDRIAHLEKEKVQAELSFLKAQIHPHFLFNTLNNLYLLAIDKSDQAPEVVQKLSEIVDYTFNQISQDWIPIEKEVDLIQNYIDLEWLRYGDRLDLQFHQDLQVKNLKIAPLILLSIVENAFKHGASGEIGKPVINISLSTTPTQIHFRVFNSKPYTSQQDHTGFKKGIGSKNVKRQLELLYPKRYEFHIDNQPNSYEVNLIIKQEHLSQERSNFFRKPIPSSTFQTTQS